MKIKLAPIGLKIRAARLDRNISQKDLSILLRRNGTGLYPANVCRIEKGIDDPAWSTVEAVAEVLEMPIAELICYDEFRTNSSHHGSAQDGIRVPKSYNLNFMSLPSILEPPMSKRIKAHR